MTSAQVFLEIEEQFGPFGERVWLNTAHQGILPKAAADAAREAIRWKRHPHELTTERFSAVPAQLREALSRLLLVSGDEIVLGNSSSYGLHLIANGFPWRPGDEVLVVRGDFPSTILPWLTLNRQGVETRLIEPGGEVLTADDVAAHLTPRTRVLCTTWVHSFAGSVIDERAIGEICRARGVRFVLNGSQGIGARPFAPASMPVDAVTSVGFKWLCGPYGTGFCWIRPDLLDSLERRQLYWLVFQSADELEGGSEPDLLRRFGAREYDVFGTANFLNFTAWQAALEVLLGYGLERVASAHEALVERFVAGLDPSQFTLLSPRSGRRRSSLVFVSHLRPERNREVFERLRAAGVDAALRRGHLRFSPHLYNTPADIDRALETLHGA